MGDISLYRSDGIIEYCGRANCQIKLCGQRIERGEIENMIAKHSTVQSKHAATVIRTVQDPPAIVAFVEFNDVLGEHLGEEKQALKAFFSVRLPWFMYLIAYPVLPQLSCRTMGRLIAMHSSLWTSRHFHLT